MGFFFPISKSRSPFLATLFTFVGPVFYGAVSGATVYLIARYFIGDSDWSRAMGLFACVMTAIAEVLGIKSCFDMDGEITLREVLTTVPIRAAFWALVCGAGFGSYPWLHTKLPVWLQELDYPTLAKELGEYAFFVALATAALAATFLRLLANNYSTRGTTRGEKVGTIKAVRQMLAQRRKRHEAQREDKILKQIHRDGGTSKVAKGDLEFLKQRARTPRWQKK